MSRPRKLGLRDLKDEQRQGYPGQLNVRITEEDLIDLHKACVMANLPASVIVRRAMRIAIDQVMAEAEKK